MRNDLKSAVVCIVGLGYVGLPLAKAFSKSLKVIGFDTDDQKIKQLSQRGSATLTFTTDSKQIGKADFIIIAVRIRRPGGQGSDAAEDAVYQVLNVVRDP